MEGSCFLIRPKYIVFYLLIIVSTLLFLGCNLKFSNSSSNSSLQNTMLVHYIDVGQGDSVLIQVNNKNILIDSGPNDSKNKLFTYLESQKIKKLDYVIATHPHEDHIGNMYDIVKKYSINEFYARATRL